MRIVLELLRIIFIFSILGGFGWMGLEMLYRGNEVAETWGWIGGFAILILLFVLYRNKLQFSGWYQVDKRCKLPKQVSSILIISSIFLIFTPIIISLVN